MYTIIYSLINMIEQIGSSAFMGKINQLHVTTQLTMTAFTIADKHKHAHAHVCSALVFPNVWCVVRSSLRRFCRSALVICCTYGGRLIGGLEVDVWSWSVNSPASSLVALVVRSLEDQTAIKEKEPFTLFSLPALQLGDCVQITLAHTLGEELHVAHLVFKTSTSTLSARSSEGECRITRGMEAEEAARTVGM